MNNRLLFPGLIVASLVAAITLAPVLASATAGFLDVNKAFVAKKSNGGIAALFLADSRIPKDGSDGAFGYGVVFGDVLSGAKDSLAVITTHKGVYDSEDQASADDPKWHAHLVQPVDGSANGCEPNVAIGGLSLKVGQLSKESPGHTIVLGKAASFTHIPAELTGESVLSPDPVTFQRGNDVAAGGSFTLRIDDSTGGAICIENVTPADQTTVYP
jgi:hypothetical protein